MKHTSLPLVALALLTGSAYAQTSGTIELKGTVGKTASIEVQSQAGYQSLDIAGGVSQKLVANVIEKSNDKAGYTVTLASANTPNGQGANAFVLKATGNSDQVPYTLTYQGEPVALEGASATVTSAASRTDVAGAKKELRVSITAAWVNDDTYSDTLTLTIANK